MRGVYKQTTAQRSLESRATGPKRQGHLMTDRAELVNFTVWPNKDKGVTTPQDLLALPHGRREEGAGERFMTCDPGVKQRISALTRRGIDSCIS